MEKMKLYCCGGTGINIGRVFAKYSGKVTAGAATLETVFVDTSDSNINEETPTDMTYLVQNLEGTGKLKGGGKVRSTNYEAIEAAIPDILHTHKPEAVNLILHSSSGGSGSVAGPLIARELVERGESVIVLMVGTEGSYQEVKNSIFSHATYESIVEDIEQPVAVFYREVGQKTRAQVDKEMRTAISVLQVLFSGQNKELDYEDGKNFLFWNRPLKIAPKLGHMDLYSEEIKLEKGQVLISTLTVTDEDKSSETNIPTEYHSVGFINPEARKTLVLPAPIHLGISLGNFFASITNRLQAKKTEYEKNRELVAERPVATAAVKDGKKTSKGIMMD